MNLPKFPKKIRVLTRTYSLSYDKKLSAWGQTDRVLATIKINPDKCGCAEQILRTLWHEVGHAWCWECGISSALNDSTEELIVESLSALVCDLTNGKLLQK